MIALKQNKYKIGIVCYPTYGGSGVVATELGMALANKNQQNNKQEPPKADPNKVCNIPIGDSFSKGPDDAAVTIIEWSDFQ